MAPRPIQPGIYRIHAHIIGPTSLVTAREHAVEHGAPVTTDRPMTPPFQQEWAITPAEPVPGAPYVINLAFHEQAGLVIAEDKLWVNNVSREQLAKFTFEPVLGGIKMLSDKGLALRVGHHGAQLELVPPKPDFQETWTLEFVRPIGEDD